ASYTDLMGFAALYPSYNAAASSLRNHSVARRGITASSLRGLRVIAHRRTRAHQIAVAIGVVDAADRAPGFVGPGDAVGEAALRPAVGAIPSIVGDVVHGVRRIAERRGLDLEAAALDLGDLLADRDHGIAEPIQLGLGFGFRRLDHQRARHREAHGR